MTHDEESYMAQVSDKLEDHTGNDIVEIDIFIEVSNETDVNTLPFNAITALMQRLAKEASRALIGIFKEIKDSENNGDIRPSGKGLSPKG